MFIVELTYKKSLAEVERYLEEHRDFLERALEENHLIAAGRKNPRTGGVIISQLSNRAELDAFIQQDPFYKHDIADYKIIDFTLTKYHSNFSSFIVEK